MSAAAHLKSLGDASSAENGRAREGRRRWTETEFLPAALEVVETPPSPIGRWMLWVIVAAAVTALAWACLSTVDVVAVAEGRLVSAGRLRSVETAEGGVVRAILVREGQTVRAGDPLIELDPTIAEAGTETARSELSTSALTRARSIALLSYAEGRSGALPSVPGADAAAMAASRQVIDARIREYEARRSGLVERRTAAEAAVRVAEQERLRATDLLPLAEQQLAARRALERQGLAPRLRVMEAEERVITLRRDEGAQIARVDESRGQVAAIGRELAQLAQEFRGRAAQELAEAEATVSTRSETVRVAEQRQGRQRLVAPVDGVVQEVSVATLGEVADGGQRIVTIVPAGEALVVEALLLNRDVGFVRSGSEAVVKLEAYPFTRHGTLAGAVLNISPDAIVDERRGLVFPARVQLAPSALRFAGRRPALSPGMSATVEFITGRRRVIEYLWSPVARATSEAGRER